VRAVPDLQARAFSRAHASLFEIKGNRAIPMGWEISGKGDNELRAKSGAGAGFSSWVAFEPKTKRGVVVLTNVQGANEAPGALGKEMLRALR
jgi:CubicO group peptidase (beta-lactamase class C family)